MDQTKLWCLEDFDLFKKMTPEQIKSLEESVFSRELKKGEKLNLPKKLQKYVYLVKDGVLKVIASDEKGNETIVLLLKKGNIFGELPLLGDFEILEDYAIAAQDSVVCFIDADKLKQWMRENEDIRIVVNQQIGEQMRKIESRLLSLIFKDARTRIYEFLIDFAKEFGTKTEKGYEVKNFLTNDDVAKLTATSRQTVNSILNELRDKHMIDYDKDTLVIPSSSHLLMHERKAS
jgi:CRP/FNR family transcriptional regulator